MGVRRWLFLLAALVWLTWGDPIVASDHATSPLAGRGPPSAAWPGFTAGQREQYLRDLAVRWSDLASHDRFPPYGEDDRLTLLGMRTALDGEIRAERTALRQAGTSDLDGGPVSRLRFLARERDMVDRTLFRRDMAALSEGGDDAVAARLRGLTAPQAQWLLSHLTTKRAGELLRQSEVQRLSALLSAHRDAKEDHRIVAGERQHQEREEREAEELARQVEIELARLLDPDYRTIKTDYEAALAAILEATGRGEKNAEGVDLRPPASQYQCHIRDCRKGAQHAPPEKVSALVRKAGSCLLTREETQRTAAEELVRRRQGTSEPGLANLGLQARMLQDAELRKGIERDLVEPWVAEQRWEFWGTLRDRYLGREASDAEEKKVGWLFRDYRYFRPQAHVDTTKKR